MKQFLEMKNFQCHYLKLKTIQYVKTEFQIIKFQMENFKLLKLMELRSWFLLQICA